MKIIEKRNIDTPLLSIESFGVHWKPNGWGTNDNYTKYFVASLDFNVKKLFGSYNKQIYIPILFFDENEIKSIMAHYSDIYFILRFKYSYSDTHYSDLYHISNIVDIEKIYKKELNSFLNGETHHTTEYGIDFIVRDYKGYDIVLNTQFTSHGYVDNVGLPEIETICAIDGYNLIEGTCLSQIEKNYKKFPQLTSYSIKQTNSDTYHSIYNIDKFDKMLKYIDKKDEERQEREKKLETMYSKKTFKLVEDL